MIINKNTWHYRWFMKYVINKFTDNGRYCGDEQMEDSYVIGWEYGTLTLCTYVKVILLYAPIRFLWTSKISRLSILNIILFLIIWAELTVPAFNANMFLVSTALFGVSVILSFMVVMIVYEGPIRAKISNFRRASEKTISTSFLSVLKEYYKASKDKICPFVKFEE